MLGLKVVVIGKTSVFTVRFDFSFSLSFLAPLTSSSFAF